MLDYPVTYHGFPLNSTTGTGEGRRKGCIIEEFDFGQVAGVGYTEKRAQDDGLDASDVYLGRRIISISGVVYGDSPADLHDRLQQLRTALTPTVSYDYDQPHQGYIPLTFTLPTLNLVDFPDGLRPLEFRARPLGQPQFSLRRDGGSEPGAGSSKGGGVSWRCVLECKDPRMYVWPYEELAWTAAATNAPIHNRGDYPAPLDVVLVLASASPSNGTGKVEIDIGNSNMTFLLGTPAVTGPPAVPATFFPAGTIFRYSGTLKVLTVQQPSATEVLRMDLYTFRNNTTHPALPPGDSKYSIRLLNGVTVMGAGTRFMFSESFA